MAAIDRGLILPVFFDAGGTIDDLAEDNRLIDSAFNMILGTDPGERPFEKDFGRDIVQFIFMNPDDTVSKAIAELTFAKLKTFEDRAFVNIIDVVVDRKKKGQLQLKIKYIRIASGESAEADILVVA